MAMIRVPHLNDNYSEIVGSFSSVETVMSAVFGSLDQSLQSSFQKDLDAATDEDEVRATIQVLDHYQYAVGPQYLSYSYLLMITATIEKNNKILSLDGFAVTNKREFVKISRRKGLLTETAYDPLDQLVSDLFELRNFIAHSFGRSLAEPKNARVHEIIARSEQIELRRDGELQIDKPYLDSAVSLLKHAYHDMAKIVYPT